MATCVVKVKSAQVGFQNQRKSDQKSEEKITNLRMPGCAFLFVTKKPPREARAKSALLFLTKEYPNPPKLASKINGKPSKNRKKKRQEIGYRFFIDLGCDFNNFWCQNGTKLDEKPKQHLTLCVRS